MKEQSFLRIAELMSSAHAEIKRAALSAVFKFNKMIYYHEYRQGAEKKI